MTAVLLFGILLGMRHALDADHLAAVASLAGRSGGSSQVMRLGLYWAVGHSVTLVAVGSLLMLIDGTISPTWQAALECLVGFMLIALGAGVVRRVMVDRIHIHAHHHGDDLHIHAHSHSRVDRKKTTHDHAHVTALSRRAALVGLVHGLAGSAGLVLLTLVTVDSLWVGLGYIALFALGSLVGMVALSCIIALPVKLLARRLTLQFNVALVLVGVWTIVLGSAVLVENAGMVAQGL